MDNRYQLFLRETLKPGLEKLLLDPAAVEVKDIPRSSFEVLIAAFRSNLPEELLKNLPQHSLADKNYLNALIKRIDFLTSRPEETENQTLTNMPPLENLMAAYDEAQKLKTNIAASQEGWQKIYQQQVDRYNADFTARLEKQLKESLPSVADNDQIIKPLAQKIAQDVQDGALRAPAEKYGYSYQTRGIVQEATETALKTYASTAEEISQKPELAAQIAETIAQKETTLQEKSLDEGGVNEPATALKKKTTSLWDVRSAQISATALPTTYNVDSVLRTAIVANLPLPLAQDPDVVGALTEEIKSKIQMAAGSTEAEYQQYLAQQTRAILTQKKVAKLLEQRGLAAAQIGELASSISGRVAEQATPEIYKTASSNIITPFLGSTVAAGSGAVSPVQIIPPIPPPPPLPPPPIPPIPGAPGPVSAAPVNVSGPSVGIPGISGGGVSVTGYVAQGSPLELLQASGSPLHFLTALTSPTSAVDFGKYLLTLGPIRSGFWFAWESFGLAKPDYLQIGLFGLDQMFSDLYGSLYGEDPYGRPFVDKNGNFIEGLYEKLSRASGHEKYVLQREVNETEKRFGFVKKFFDGIHNNPSLDQAYKLFFGEPGKILGIIDTRNWPGPFKNMTLGAYHLTHPWQAFTSSLYQKNILLGLGFSGFFDSLSAYAKYGGYGGAYVTQEYIKMFGVYLLKVAGAKIGLYEVVGQGIHRRYVFKPLNRAKLWAQHIISGGVKGAAKWTAAQLSKTAVGKTIVAGVTKLATWIGTRIGSLISGIASIIGIVLLVWDAVKILWGLFKKAAKWTAAFLLYLFSLYGAPALLGALGGLLLTPFFLPFFGIFAPLAAVLFGAGAGITVSQFFGGIKSLAGNFLSSSFSFAGNLLSQITGGLPSLSSVALPTLSIAGISVTALSLFTMFTIQSGFWNPLLQSPLQSEYIKVTKTGQFSGKIGDPINYTLTVTALLKPLTNVKIIDTTTFNCQGTAPTVAVREFTVASISTATPWVQNYSVPTNNQFNNCLVTNTAAVTADVPDAGKTNEQSFAIFSLTIGSPPLDLPSGWPVSSGCITQGPNGSTSHARYREEALDIDGNLINKPVFATHNGTVSRVINNQNTSTTGYGNYVILSGVGQNGTSFSTLYAHLMTVSVANGQKMSRGAQIGTVGLSGNADAPHLHYEFLGLKLIPPFVPTNVFNPANLNNIRNCSSREACNLCF